MTAEGEAGRGSRPRLGAIILSGGRATRMGGAAKTSLEVAGTSLLQRTTDAALAACDGLVVIVGDAGATTRAASSGAEAGAAERAAAERVVAVREDPPGGGPVAAIAAAIGDVDADRLLLLAGDLVDGARAVQVLIEAGADARGSGDDPAAGGDGIVLVDGAGREQWLCSLVRTDALRGAAVGIRSPSGERLSALLSPLRLVRVPDGAGVSADVDTWQDLSRARSRAGSRVGASEASGVQMSDRTLPPEALDEWSSVLRDRFGLDAEAVPIALILDLARDVAHDVARPAAPLSAFIAGLVAGRAGGGVEATSDTVAEVVSLARAWAEGREADAGGAARGGGGGV